MSNVNCFRTVIYNNFLGLSKELSAPTKYELDIKVENQKRIWEEKVERELVKQDKEQMRFKAQKLTNMAQERMHDYENIIKKISSQGYLKYYDSLLDESKYQDYISKLTQPTLEEINDELKVPQKSFLEILLTKRKMLRLEKESEARTVYTIKCEEYNKKLRKEKEEYECAKRKFIQEQKNKNDLIEINKQKFLNHDLEQIEKYFTYVLKSSEYPKYFVKDFKLQYIPETKKMVVWYNLHNIEAIPRILQYKYVNARNEIDVVKLSDKKFDKLYNDIVYMCCLKTIKEIFESDELNNVDNVVYNGWLNYIDKKTGQETGGCIITLKVDKDKFANINLDNVDYKACIKGLKGMFITSVLEIEPVIPYMKINREDNRFVENKEVANIDLDGFNLATMPWEDFEYFVRELFEKMFKETGGEVKVTRASRDGA